LGARAGTATARPALTARARRVAAVARGSRRLDRRKRGELEQLVRHDADLFAEQLAGLGTWARREQRSGDEADDEETERRANETKHQAALPFGGYPSRPYSLIFAYRRRR